MNAIIASDDFADIVEDSTPSRPVPPKLAEVNARHFTVLTAGKYLVGRESVCPHFGHVVVEWFPDVAVQKHLNASTVTLEDGTRRPLGTWWIKHEDRRQYDGVVFDPTPGAKHLGLYNLWRGWSVASVKGDWSLMQRLLLDVLCAGDQVSFEYVLKWAAYMVQHPNSPAEVALVFATSMIWNWLGPTCSRWAIARKRLAYGVAAVFSDAGSRSPSALTS